MAFETVMGVFALQVLGAAFALFFLYYSYTQYRKRVFDSFDLGLWASVWGALLAASLFPYALSPIFVPSLFIRTLDFLVISAILLLFALGFLIYKKLRLYQKKTEELVRLSVVLRKKR